MAKAQVLIDIARTTQQASVELGTLANDERNQGLWAMAQALEDHQDLIIQANQLDCDRSAQQNIAPSLQARLVLNESKLKDAIAGVRQVASLYPVLNQVQIHRELDQDLILQRVSCPLGVIGVIFEARPDALIQITSLALKSGNAVMLKGGQEAIETCRVLTKVIKEALTPTKINPEVIQLLTTRAEITELLKLDQYVDLIIPRGSNQFVQYVQANTNISVLGHADGICHLYVDQEVDFNEAIAIAVDSKTQYPTACNAIETLLIHEAIATEFLPLVAQALIDKGVKLKGDSQARQIQAMEEATPEDWATEYSDLILAIKVVGGLDEALEHIRTYSSRHTEAIATTNDATAQKFLQRVDAAGVYHNCSTRFADGFRYGFGAEVGISTQKMPPRGPVGLEGLVTYKYYLTGKGHRAATYTGLDAKAFTHRDLPSS
jgi:glutamate-5-semialdehyde dehydrogenase